MAHQTPKGSWNAKQLKCIGIDWPAPKGWIKRAVGTEIDEMYRVWFEKCAGEPAKDKINVQDQERRIADLERDLHQLKVFVGYDQIF